MRKALTLLSTAVTIAGLALVSASPATQALPGGFADSPVVATSFSKPNRAVYVSSPTGQSVGGAHAFTAYPRAERVFDSRNGIGGPVGAVAGGRTRTVSLHVPAGASAALVNITLDNAAGPGQACPVSSYLVAWKPGTAMPSTSNANVGGCDVAANTGVVQVDAAGAINLQVYADVDVILDVLGYYSPSVGPVAAGRFQALNPTRLIDTRAPSAAGNDYSRTNDGNTSLVRLPVAGRGGVPAGAKTVSLTVTAIGPGSDASGYVTAYAGGSTRPETSTVNHSGGFDTRANLALVPVGADGAVELYLYQVANVVVDVGGWITSASDAAAVGGRLHLVAPTRIADSRNGIGMAAPAPGGQVTLEPFGVPSSAMGIAQNVTMVSRAPGWICATPSPWSGGDVSIQNARTANQDRPAFTFTTLGAGPAARLRYCSQDRADIIVDVMGWFEQSDANGQEPRPDPSECVGAPNTPGGPDPWGGCWPGPHNTGVPDGVTLSAYSGPCEIRSGTVVIDSKLVECTLEITNANVTIRNSRIVGGIQSEHGSFTVIDSIVDRSSFSGQTATAVGEENFTLLRVEVIGGNRTAFCDGPCSITDSWVHGQRVNGDAHASGIRQSQDGVFRHNTITCDANRTANGGCSAGLTGYGDAEPVTRNLIERNLFVPGSSTMCAYGGASGNDGSKPYGNRSSYIRFIENVFQRGASGRCGNLGAVRSFDPSRPGNQFLGNTWDDGTPMSYD